VQKKAELSKMPFGLWTHICLWEACVTCGAHWHNLANMIEPSMCGGDAVFLSNFFDHLLF